MKRVAYGFVSGLRTETRLFFKDNLIKVVCVAFIIVIGILTGVLTAVKSEGLTYYGIFTDYTLVEFSEGSLASFGVFFARFFSANLVLALLSVFLFTVFTVPIGYVIIIYRSYLVGLNVSLMVMLFGFDGIVRGLLIILPCQLIILCALGIYSCLFLKLTTLKRKYGSCMKGRLNLFFITLALILFVVTLETILLMIFSARVILVI